ncbi:class I SAM-dependent methyltransferase [Azospirillum picis]|uniref:Phosphatidylethanolamine/phosphatidyl-N-methylethanolamine N-methyltransferase n=1 Tax=Azospirillum picis TaxID=488438 RepID=A0ABU0MSY0_9PROT|nr:ribose ABC transporter permease [Azospirillum picis]MBP2302902.1 phosphatidylethanolamine/phosphatidyl-N-methylethanolamine N-methyltransferase [Azospirillum picis]MDQ0536593.1 phosphatidylethanolamine/phosphatidyl-N-methylethanolamine N-methyltransferase [Azospirillum picis]
MSLAERKLFVERWIRSPLKVASVTPSGPELCRAMAKAALAGPARRVVELGPGTGPVTSALLSHGVSPDNLLMIELDPAFADHLALQHPTATVVRGDATRMQRILQTHGWPECNAVVSGLPLIAMPLSVQARIVRSAFSMLAPDGLFVQFTYGPFAPVNPELIRRMRLKPRRFAWIARNLPPASVWTFRRLP